jgi:hypothetical protein
MSFGNTEADRIAVSRLPDRRALAHTSQRATRRSTRRWTRSL